MEVGGTVGREGMDDGSIVGVIEGTQDGIAEGTTEGLHEGLFDGLLDGKDDGLVEGSLLGTDEGRVDGSIVGPLDKFVGQDVGDLIGRGLGWRVRLAPPANKSSVGVIVGIVVGENDGVLLGQHDGRHW
jgi:hypothetical protein